MSLLHTFTDISNYFHMKIFHKSKITIKFHPLNCHEDTEREEVSRCPLSVV